MTACQLYNCVYVYSISYEKWIKIKTEVANSVRRETKLNSIYVPLNLDEGKYINFVIDDVNFKNDTPERKAEFHGISTTLFQKSSNKIFKKLKDHQIQNWNLNQYLYHLQNSSISQILFRNISSVLLDQCLMKILQGKAWAVCQSVDHFKGTLSNWAATNYLLLSQEDFTKCQ